MNGLHPLFRLVSVFASNCGPVVAEAEADSVRPGRPSKVVHALRPQVPVQAGLRVHEEEHRTRCSLLVKFINIAQSTCRWRHRCPLPVGRWPLRFWLKIIAHEWTPYHWATTVASSSMKPFFIQAQATYFSSGKCWHLTACLNLLISL